MGDLKSGETFTDCVYITLASTGAAATGLAPTCTIVKVSDGTRTAGTVSELGSGWYKVTDFTPDAAGNWLTEWALSSLYQIHYSFKEFKVGGGQVADLATTLGTPAGADLATDIAAINTALAYEHQPDAVLAQASPAQNTWYTIIDTTANVKIYCINVMIATTAETLNVRITIDGQTLQATMTGLTLGSYYNLYLQPIDGTLNWQTSNNSLNFMYLEGRSVKVDARKTTANGTGTLNARVIWAKR